MRFRPVPAADKTRQGILRMGPRLDPLNCRIGDRLLMKACRQHLPGGLAKIAQLCQQAAPIHVGGNVDADAGTPPRECLNVGQTLDAMSLACAAPPDRGDEIQHEGTSVKAEFSPSGAGAFHGRHAFIVTSYPVI